MDEYNLIVEELIERVESGELTLEEAEVVNDYAYDLYTTEGANLDARREFKTASKDIKTKLQMAKREYKAGNYEKAIQLADEVIEDTKKLESTLDAISDASGVGSAVIGWYASNLLVSLKAMALGLVTFGIGSVVTAIKNLIDIVEDIIKAINAAEMGELDPGKLNKYINQLKRATREMRKAAIRVKATINAKSK